LKHYSKVAKLMKQSIWLRASQKQKMIMMVKKRLQLYWKKKKKI